MPRVLLLLSATALLLLTACGNPEDELILGVTTSVQDAGLLDVLVEAFEDEYDYDVKPIVGGSGQTLELAREGEMDVIMTHSPADEGTFIEEGYGTDKTPVMQNFFVIAGPEDDPAGVADAVDMADAFARIAEGEHGFISRGDSSGTHRREQSYWDVAGIDPVGQGWYTESATSQGQNLLVANDTDTYTLVDSSTFISFAERLEIVELLRDRDKPNVYSVVRIDAERLDKVNADAADDWLEFMTGPAQNIIATFGVDEHGEPLFEPLAQ